MSFTSPVKSIGYNHFTALIRVLSNFFCYYAQLAYNALSNPNRRALRVLNKILPASLLITPFSAYHAAPSTLFSPEQRISIISKETVERIRTSLAIERRPRKVTLSFTNREREALIGQVEQKYELMKLPVNLKVYPAELSYARFTRNQNVFLVADAETPFTIPAGSIVLINDCSIKLPRETAVLGGEILMHGKRKRFDDAPGLAPAGATYFMTHARGKKTSQSMLEPLSIAA